jgi:predicted dehydrogenase
MKSDSSPNQRPDPSTSASTLPLRIHEPVTFAILACGARGNGAAHWIHRNPNMAKLIALADPNADRRDRIGDVHGVPADLRFDSWQALLAKPKLADAVINTTMDALHAPSALAALNLGYHMMLEKPMATTVTDCIAIDAARQKNNRIVSVCHSLRYQIVYREVKRLIASGAIGDVISIDQLEAVDPVHQSHSYVRGNWANESRSTFMLLAKSCHDVDILVHLMGRDVTRVSSFGGLSHFTKANQPTGAPHRCTDGCPVESTCPYSSLKVYVNGTWGNYIGLKHLTPEQRVEFVKTSKYGICVYDSDNDVVDHQTVNFEFEGGATGTFTMTAFAKGGRQLRIHGTHGEIHANIDQRKIQVRKFWDPQEDDTITPAEETGGHGGGDDHVMRTLVEAIVANDPSKILTGTETSLKTHAATFAAEMSRKQGRVISLSELLSS